uniref:Uncharacterized protein n=1 Tax=Oryza meridionalis TaxID=40149 RepID=A0A0E0EHS7_9ORYZ
MARRESASVAPSCSLAAADEELDPCRRRGPMGRTGVGGFGGSDLGILGEGEGGRYPWVPLGACTVKKLARKLFVLRVTVWYLIPVLGL